MAFVRIVASPRSGPRASVLPEIAARCYRQPGFWQGQAKAIRRGPGSLEQQIEQRTYQDLEGVSHPWVEPSYARGLGLPAAAKAREDVLWDAALGRGAGAITRHTDFSISVGVNDAGVRARSAAIGNQIVSTAPYFGFVTGDFGERTAPALAKPGKGVRQSGGRRRFSRIDRDVTQDPGFKEAYTRVTRESAMWWFLGITYKAWLTEAQLSAGVLTPPKNIGPSAVMVERIREALADFIVAPTSGDFYRDSGLAQGRRFDPRRRR